MEKLSFLELHQKQIAEFDFDVSDRMLAFGDFFTTPNYTKNKNTPQSKANNIVGGAIHRGVFKPILLEQSHHTELIFMEDGGGSGWV